MREVMLGLILLLVLEVERFVITLLELLKFKLLLLELLTLDVPLLELFLLVTTLLERLLLDGAAGLIELTTRDVMSGLILLLVLVVERFVIVFRVELLELMVLPILDVKFELILLFDLLCVKAEELSAGRLAALLLLERFEIEEFDRVVICWPSVLEFGAVIRVLIDGLDVRLVITLLELEVLLFVMALLEVLGLIVRLVMARLELLTLGVRLVILLFDMLLLGVLLIVGRLVLRLDETLLERLDVLALGAALGAGAGRETLRLELLELLELRLERDLAAKTGS